MTLLLATQPPQHPPSHLPHNTASNMKVHFPMYMVDSLTLQCAQTQTSSLTPTTYWYNHFSNTLPILTNTVVLSTFTSAHVNTSFLSTFSSPPSPHLAVELLVQQDVPCSNVSVDKGLTSQAHQAVHHLLTELQQITRQVWIRP